MAGEIKINDVSIATESGGTVTIAPNNVTFAANHAGIKAALNASGSAGVYACRAWVNFDGTTNTAGFCTIRDSGNVSTVADNGTGDYTINFATAMPDNDYVVTSVGSAGASQSVRTPTVVDGNTKSTTQLQVRYQRYDSTLSDQSNCFLAIFR